MTSTIENRNVEHEFDGSDGRRRRSVRRQVVIGPEYKVIRGSAVLEYTDEASEEELDHLQSVIEDHLHEVRRAIEMKLTEEACKRALSDMALSDMKNPR